MDELRVYLLKIAVVTIGCGIIAYLFKEELFTVILAPKQDDFITYRIFHLIWNRLSLPEVNSGIFSVKLINTGLAEQFIIHVKTALYVGLLCASPYILYLLFRFVSPALYTKEKKYALRMVGGGYAMFITGAALNYLIIFPLTFRFLGTYQVSTEVENMISLQSYMDTLLMMNLMMGIVFEIPILCWLLALSGFISAPFMRPYRRHATITILIIAAIITPTSDVFTLSLVAMPMFLLYELSILLVKRTVSKKIRTNNNN
ncbi:twin-arginine translocase subunit TatC [Gabonibacter massiliensis]|uniref:twin-arginine translocase subunit TatC n=1 Tax=Gabonibacter massiliensis TaxID=1720195 RepID=UPI00073F9273|nr:twin-arginine translocase subunit TatC [Gabonibacter massiliensis]